MSCRATAWQHAVVNRARLFVGILLRHDRLLAGYSAMAMATPTTSAWCFTTGGSGFDNMFFRAPMTPARPGKHLAAARFHFEQPVSSTAQPF